MADRPVTPSKKGEIEPITYANKVIAVKRKCSCGGDVDVRPNPDGPGKIAICRDCGATLKFGGG
ncbi:MAG: hypothetical protein N2204_03710 [Anaerolineae bacterium]|nr:hypothetical protein [Anaerolineae bacterium]